MKSAAWTFNGSAERALPWAFAFFAAFTLARSALRRWDRVIELELEEDIVKNGCEE